MITFPSTPLPVSVAIPMTTTASILITRAGDMATRRWQSPSSSPRYVSLSTTIQKKTPRSSESQKGKKKKTKQIQIRSIERGRVAYIYIHMWTSIAAGLSLSVPDQRPSTSYSPPPAPDNRQSATIFHLGCAAL